MVELERAFMLHRQSFQTYTCIHIYEHSTKHYTHSATKYGLFIYDMIMHFSAHSAQNIKLNCVVTMFHIASHCAMHLHIVVQYNVSFTSDTHMLAHTAIFDYIVFSFEC